MSPLTSLLLALTILVGMAPAAIAKETPVLPFEEYGELDGVPYEIKIPENWNGGLVMYVHGYIMVDQPYGFDGPPSHPTQMLFSHAREKGYATARSAFSRNGMNWRDAADENEALRAHFEKRFGLEGKVFVAGLHGGGYIVRFAQELYGDKYDGFLGLASSGGAVMNTYGRLFDLVVLAKHYFPGLPWSPTDYSGLVWNPDLIYAEMDKAGPQKVADFLKLTEQPNREQAARALLLFSMNVRDLIVGATGGKNPFDTRDQVYFGSSDDVTLNREIQRYEADPEAAAIIRERWNLTGRVTKPYLNINSLNDYAVPARSIAYYRELVHARGSQDNYVQMWVNWDGPMYSTELVEKAFDLIEAWVVDGKRPASGELTP